MDGLREAEITEAAANFLEGSQIEQHKMKDERHYH